MPTLSHEQLAVSAAKLAESFMAAQAEGEVSYTDDLIGKVSGNRSNFSEDDYQGIVTCLEKRKARQQQQSLHRFIQESLGSLAQDTSAESSSEDEELDELSTGTTGLDELFKHLGLTHDQLESVCLYDQVVRLTEVALVLIPERPAMNIQRSISKMYMQHARLLSADQMQTLEGLVGKLAPRERSSLLLLVQMKLVKEYVFNLEQGASSDTPRSGVEFGMQMSLLRRLVRAICNEAMEEALVNNLAGDFQYSIQELYSQVDPSQFESFAPTDNVEASSALATSQASQGSFISDQSIDEAIRDAFPNQRDAILNLSAIGIGFESGSLLSRIIGMDYRKPQDKQTNVSSCSSDGPQAM